MKFISYPTKPLLNNPFKLFKHLLGFERAFFARLLLGLGGALMVPTVYAAPVWTFTPLTPTSVTVPVDGEVSVKYKITNQSTRPHTLSMNPIPGVLQIITAGNCSKQFRLGYMESCTLNLKIQWRALQGNISGGPIVCNRGNALECYRPSQPLHIIKGNVPRIILKVTPTVLRFTVDTQGSILVKNSAQSTQSAKHIKISIPSRSNIKIQGNTCGSSLAIGSTCKITFKSDEVETSTPIFIKSTNSNQVRVKASVSSAAKFQVGGTVSGLDDAKQLILQNNGRNNLTITGNGPFVFPELFDKGAPFSVSILNQPSTQSCRVTNANGVVGAQSATVVRITCENLRTIGGTVNGLAESLSLVLQNNKSNNLTITKNGSFRFSKALKAGESYNVTLLNAPDTQTCTIANHQGNVGAQNITNVKVNCTIKTTKVAVGSYFDDQNSSMLGTSKGASTNWSFPIESGYTFTATSCSGIDSAICTAVGNYSGLGQGVLFYSKNSGESWSKATSGQDNASAYFGTSCSGSICTAVGRNKQAQLFINVSQDGGETWTPATIDNFSGRLNTTSCSGTGLGARCIAAGQATGPSRAVLYASLNGGVSWTLIPSPPISGFNLFGSSCSGSGTDAICVAVGTRTSNPASGTAAIFVSRDGGATWNGVGLPDSAIGSQLNSVSCVGDKNNGECVAVGLNRLTQRGLIFSSLDGGQTWSQSLSLGISSVFNSVSCTKVTNSNNVLCTTVGRNNTNLRPLVYQRSGGNWVEKNVTQTNSVFNSVSCVGNDTSATCVTAGQYIPQNNSIIFVSKDGGDNWAQDSLSYDVGSFVSVSCAGTGASPICTSVGTGSSSPFLSQSNDGGNVWKKINLPTKYGLLNSVSCTGAGLNAVCAASGINNNGNTTLLYLGKPQANLTWNWQRVATESAITKQGLFTGVSCTGSGNAAICSAVGNERSNQGSGIILGAPLLYVTRDGGLTWSLKTMGNKIGFFNGVSCTGSGATAVCVAGGQDRTIGTWPSLLMMSQDGGNQWSQVDTGTNNEYLYGASCSGDGGNAVCISMGQRFDNAGSNFPPLIYITRNGGTDWTPRETSLTTSGYFYGGTCTGSGDNALCVASGHDDISGDALLYFSQNSGQDWTLQPLLTNSNQGDTYLYRSSCIGNGLQGSCVTAGVYAGDYPSYAYVGRTDKGSPMQWNLATPSTSSGFLSSVNCNDEGGAIICLLGGGEELSAESPLTQPSIYKSKNGGATWQTVPMVFPNLFGGQINSISSTK